MPEEPLALSAPKGTNDVLPPFSWEWQGLMRAALDTFALAGYAPIETPSFENTEVFVRGAGPGSEVVTKQMYTFEDKGGRSLTLRPEGTAPVVRAVLEHNLARGALPVKLAYAGAMFRQERPQKGRYRQFFQVGVEALGIDSPVLDAEVVELGWRFIASMLPPEVVPTLLLNTIGHPGPECRERYIDELASFLRGRIDDLAPGDGERAGTNPLRMFDSKEPATGAVMSGAPLVTDHVCDACRTHFEEVRALLDSIGVPYTVRPQLVRGLDYYTRTAFEYVWEGLGAQNTLGGGGRYDGLAESLGGDPLPGIGFALGVDRILLAAGRDGSAVHTKVDVYVAVFGPEAAPTGLRIATDLRRQGLGVDLDHGGRSLKGQMKDAVRSGARWVAILGEDELAAGSVALKDLSSGEQSSVPLDELPARLRSGTIPAGAAAR